MWCKLCDLWILIYFTKLFFFQNTSSGSVCVNDVIVQLSVETLPFGGVGDSKYLFAIGQLPMMIDLLNYNFWYFFSGGYGAYHGKYSYDTFSHKKSVLIRDFGFLGEKLGEFRYPPYSESTVTTARRLMSITELPSVPNIIKYLTCIALGVVLVIGSKALAKSFGQNVPDWLWKVTV